NPFLMSDYKTILSINLGLLVAVLLFKVDELIYVLLAIDFLCLLSEKIAVFLVQIINKIISTVATIGSTLVLGAIYCLVLFPLAILKNLLSKKKQQESSSFIERNYEYQATDFEKMW
ncbi:MAG: hypothetical protein GY810_20880, partial [Aureispira sp.]|nr:hypothetical protein [Aureispira sp.]